jgi:DNA primase
MTPTEDIKTRLDVVDVLGDYLQLKPAGSGAFKALCPFHAENTPSFHISRPRQSWHCFGCDVGGDIFSFVMKMEGMEFPEALELLANKAGVTLPAFDKQKSSLRKRLNEVNDLAARFFRSSLLTLPQAQHAREYIAKRGLDDLTADLFRIGYAPDGWTNLSDALKAKGVTEDELLQAGLAARREKGSGVYDRFRDRIMFSITDVHGNIVGFTGRILTDDKTQAKYVNTPETLIYKKSSILYGLDKAKGEIRRQDLAVIVEGNMDVVSSHQFGVLNVVAASGTALTNDQLNLIKRFTDKLAIAFDQDAAGKAATLRGLDLARAQDFSIKIITLPPEAGKDPDDAVRKDPELWRTAIKQAVSIMEWVYRQAFKGKNLQNPEDKKQIAQDVLPEIRQIVDPVERDHWLKRLAKDLAVSEDALREAIKKTPAPKQTLSQPNALRTPPAANTTPPLPPAQKPTTQQQIERRLLALSLFRPFLWQELHAKSSVPLFEDQDIKTLYETCNVAYAQLNLSSTSATADRPLPRPTNLTSDQGNLYEALAFLAEREFQDMSRAEWTGEQKSLIEHLRTLAKARQRKELEAAMRDAERVGDATLIAELARTFSELS